MEKEAELDVELGTGETAGSENSLVLVGDHRLRLERRAEEDVLRVEAPDGQIRVCVTVTASGATIELDGADLAIRSSGALDLDARRLTLRAREELRLESDANLKVRAEGAVRIEGLEQYLVSRRGDLSVYANDDVRIDGERIKMNC